MSASPQKLRWGILGTGRILAKIGPAFRLTSNAELVAIASRDAARARDAANQFGAARSHGSYEQLIADPAVNVIFNTLHNGLHCEWTVRALEAGKHVLCEKPLACSSAEVDRMFAAARTNGRRLMEGFMYRFHPQIAEAKRRVDAGQIGRVVHLRASYTGQGRERDNPRYDRDLGGGALMDIGCYCVNFARLIAGIEPARVTAQAHFDESSGVDLTLAGTLEFTGGLTAHVLCSFEAEGSYAAEVIGTAGKLLLPHPWLPPTLPAAIAVTRADKTETVACPTPHVLTPFALEIEHFGRCVQENVAPSFPPGSDAERDSHGNMRVIDALLAAARTGERVTVVPASDRRS